MSKRKGVFGRVVSAGQGIANDFTQELFGNPKFAEMLGGAITKVQGVKETFDRNMQFAFNAINLPTRGDYQKLLGKIDKMNKSVSDLEGRIDDLVVASERLASSGQKATLK